MLSKKSSLVSATTICFFFLFSSQVTAEKEWRKIYACRKINKSCRTNMDCCSENCNNKICKKIYKKKNFLECSTLCNNQSSFEPLTNENIKLAITSWLNVEKRESIESIYGKIQCWDTSKVTSLKSLFAKKKNFSLNLACWNTSSVKNMRKMFRKAKSFSLDMSNWDTSNVKNMRSMFLSAFSFNINIHDWNTSSVRYMDRMFSVSESFTLDLSKWDIYNVRDMRGMFKWAENAYVDLGSWDISGVKDKRHMFSFGRNFTIDIHAWDTSKVTDMKQMFMSATYINTDLSSWDTSSVTDMSFMFYNAHSFNSDISKWDTSNVEDMTSMFRGAESFNMSINSWNTSSVTNMAEMFFGASSFNAPLNNWNTSSVANMAGMFWGASSFNGVINDWDTSRVKDMRRTFWSASKFNRDIHAWDTSEVTDMKAMFYAAISFNRDISTWDISKVRNMKRMFLDAKAFNQDLSKWNIKKVRNFQEMFKDIPSFNQQLCWESKNFHHTMFDYSYGCIERSCCNACTMNNLFCDFSAVNKTCLEFKILILTNEQPEQTSWELKHASNDEVIGIGDSFEKAFTSYIQEFCLEEGYYIFQILDENGICCDGVPGKYELYLDDALLFSGGEFQGSEHTLFEVRSFAKTCDKIEIQVFTDEWPEETRWEIRVNDGSNEIFHTGGPFERANAFYNNFLCLEPNNYIYEISDIGFDGICCQFGDGYYEIYIRENLFAKGGIFKESEMISFQIGSNKVTCYEVQIHVYSAFWSRFIKWRIRTDNNKRDILHESGPYDEVATLYIDDLCLEPDKYILEIFSNVFRQRIAMDYFEFYVEGKLIAKRSPAPIFEPFSFTLEGEIKGKKKKRNNK